MLQARIVLFGSIANLVVSLARMPIPQATTSSPALAPDTTALVDARQAVDEIRSRERSMRVRFRSLPGSARESARVTGYIDRGVLRKVVMVSDGLTIRGVEVFWYRGDSLVLAERRILQLAPGSAREVRMGIEHRQFFLGDSLLHVTSAVTIGDGDTGAPPDAAAMRLRAKRLRLCVLAPIDDERACRGL